MRYIKLLLRLLLFSVTVVVFVCFLERVFEYTGLNNTLESVAQESITKGALKVELIDIYNRLYDKGHKGRINTEQIELEVNMILQENDEWDFLGFFKGGVAIFKYKTNLFNKLGGD